MTTPVTRLAEQFGSLVQSFGLADRTVVHCQPCLATSNPPLRKLLHDELAPPVIPETLLKEPPLSGCIKLSGDEVLKYTGPDSKCSNGRLPYGLVASV